MTKHAKISMRKFQFWTVISFILLYFFVTPDVMKVNSFNIRIVSILTSLVIGGIAVRHAIKIVRDTGDLDPEKLSEEDRVLMSMVGFGVYLFVLTFLVIGTLLINLTIACKFFLYQMIMGMAYFQQKRAALVEYQEGNSEVENYDKSQ